MKAKILIDNCFGGFGYKRVAGVLLMGLMLGVSSAFGAMEQKEAESLRSYSSNKKKILVLVSKGGACHLSAFRSRQSFLGDEYDMRGLDLVECLSCLDPINRVTCGGFDGEKLYNLFLQKGWTRLTSYLVENGAPSLMKSNYEEIKKGIMNLLELERPDLLLSIIPFFNFPACKAAEALGIPFLIVTLETDLTNWLAGMDRGITHPSYAITTWSNLEFTRNQLASARIPHDRVFNIGFPLREGFMQKNVEKFNKKIICRNFGITDLESNKFTIMLLMGGAGSGAMYDYVRRIGAMELNVHLIVCVGRNEELAQKLKRLQPQLRVSMTVVPSTDDIAQLMSLSDLFITKTGPGSINEAVQMNLPMILDATDTVLTWERPNIEFVEQNDYGWALRNLDDLEGMIKSFIMNKNYYECIKKNFYNKQPYIFDTALKDLIARLIYEQKNQMESDSYWRGYSLSS
ncbi:MAG: glycosyltransferase [Candidatus Babeliales bacterium]